MSFSRIADMAQDIANACGAGKNRNRVNGEMRDPRGFLVIVGRFMC